MTPALERLRADDAVTELTPDRLHPFLAEEGPRLLFFTGDPSRRPEVHDIAVVLRELLRAHPGTLRAGWVGLEHDAAIRAQLGVNKVPAVGFAHHGRVDEILGGIQDWARYQGAVDRLLAACRPPAPSAETGAYQRRREADR